MIGKAININDPVVLYQAYDHSKEFTLSLSEQLFGLCLCVP